MKDSNERVVKLKSGEKALLCGSYDDQNVCLIRVLTSKLFEYKFRLVSRSEIVLSR